MYLYILSLVLKKMSILPIDIVDYVNWRNQFILPKTNNNKLKKKKKEVLHKQQHYFIECMNENKRIESDKCKKLDQEIKYLMSIIN